MAELLTLFPAAQAQPADRHFQQRIHRVIASIDGRDAALSLPLDIQGTAFQQQVWQALRTIPYGETVSYQQLAKAIGKPKAVRAVASACGAKQTGDRDPLSPRCTERRFAFRLSLGCIA